MPRNRGAGVEVRDQARDSRPGTPSAGFQVWDSRRRIPSAGFQPRFATRTHMTAYLPGMPVDAIIRAVSDLLQSERRLLLAVSGGIDSMVLLDATARLRGPDHRVLVTTVDHGTGPVATKAAGLVQREARRRGLPVRVRRVVTDAATEAAWREARWRVLRAEAKAEDARIVTAHTRDDQVETVTMRILRGAGARGLAGLYARSAVLRPLLAISRQELVRYARARRLAFVEDPTNLSRRFLRNRVRLDLLPAIRRVRPDFDAELLGIADRAARLRHEVDDVAASLVVTGPDAEGLAVDAAALEALDAAGLRLVWPALAGLAGVTLDRRATERLARFTHEAQTGARVPISGGWEVVRTRETFVLRRPERAISHASVPLTSGLRFGRFRFQRVTSAASLRQPSEDPWQAWLPRDVEIVVRAWAPGDRMEFGAAGARRRVKRFFADAHIAGPLREGWPVVLVEGKIIWIPGVRCALVAADFPQQHSIVYRCEPVSR